MLRNGKGIVALIMTLVMALSLCVVSAGAVEDGGEEGRPILIEIPDEADIPESTHSPMPRDRMTNLKTITFQGLNNGYEYIWDGKTYSASDFPKKTLYDSTSLTTTGSKSKVNVGLATYIYNMDRYAVDASTLTSMGLKDNSYGWPTLNSSGRYRLAIQNLTGGVVRGTTTWYRVDQFQ